MGQPPDPGSSLDEAASVDDPSSDADAADAVQINEAEAAVLRALTLGNKVQTSTSGHPTHSAVLQDELPHVAAGPMLAELEAMVGELDAHGWMQEGSPELSEVRILIDEMDSDSERMMLEACVDYTSVVYHQDDGTQVPANPTPRAKNIFTLTTADDGTWVLYDRDFPANPAC